MKSEARSCLVLSVCVASTYGICYPEEGVWSDEANQEAGGDEAQRDYQEEVAACRIPGQIAAHHMS